MEDFTVRMDTKNTSVNKLFADTVLYDSIKLAVVELKAVMQTANSFAQNINAFSEDLEKAGNNLLDTTNTAGMLMNDKQTAVDIQTIIQNLKTSSRKLDEDLEAMQHNFLLKGYFKKTNNATPPVK
jgi:phospholipid/cholesterol/gamma-HCH transport system substrate-binding protein